MVDTIFVEEEIVGFLRTQEILSKFPRAKLLKIERYQEIFNRRNQNFRIQKRQPALILAKKYNNFVLPTPDGFGLASQKNFYFSHMYNCIYDCRYCFLQGLYSSANYVLFVNYDDFHAAIEEKIKSSPEEKMTFFSGYDCDSLAFEKISGFVASTIPLFRSHPKVELELRTKSVQLEPLLSCKPVKNCIIAFSLMPEGLAKQLDNKTPSVSRRIAALGRLADEGWPIGLRFDPLIYSESWKDRYKELVRSVVNRIPVDAIHSVSYGPLRYPKKMFGDIIKLYPDESLFSYPMEANQNFVSYGQEVEKKMSDYLINELSKYINSEKLFQCVIGD
ncbi:MAG: DNA photolyase [Rhodospirillaceae bacterium]|nr:DNA photolyase [Rhodospirillaceae bacterium]|tara:strand:- start:227 stop:1225 length:999 start_codon:yes stop_codon:yes gene_type:complete